MVEYFWKWDISTLWSSPQGDSDEYQWSGQPSFLIRQWKGGAVEKAWWVDGMECHALSMIESWLYYILSRLVPIFFVSFVTNDCHYTILPRSFTPLSRNTTVSMETAGHGLPSNFLTKCIDRVGKRLTSCHYSRAGRELLTFWLYLLYRRMVLNDVGNYLIFSCSTLANWLGQQQPGARSVRAAKLCGHIQPWWWIQRWWWLCMPCDHFTSFLSAWKLGKLIYYQKTLVERDV